MNEARSHAVLRTLTAWALAAVFLAASFPKIAYPAGFVSDLQNYHLMPWWSWNAIALILPWWELLAALALLIPSWRKGGALITLVMGVMFISAVSQALFRGLDISCGCFGHGASGAKAGVQTLLIDLFVIISSLYVLAGGTSAATPPTESIISPMPRGESESHAV